VFSLLFMSMCLILIIFIILYVNEKYLYMLNLKSTSFCSFIYSFLFSLHRSRFQLVQNIFLTQKKGKGVKIVTCVSRANAIIYSVNHKCVMTYAYITHARNLIMTTGRVFCLLKCMLHTVKYIT